MTFRNIAVPLSIALLIGLTACSTTSGAEADEPAQTQQPADDHEAHHPEDQQPEAEQDAERKQMMAQRCPMQVEGTTRNLVELDDAVAMDFTTTGDVGELRQRVETMAQMRGKMHDKEGRMHRGGMHHGEDGPGRHRQMHKEMTEEQRQMHRQMMQMMSDVTIETEEIEGGMRVKFIPDDDARVDELYEMMEQHTQMMEEAGHCPMMQMMGGEPADD